MKFRVLIVMVVLCLAVVAPISMASPWAVTVINNTNAIFMVDLGTTPPTVHGPYLNTPLGTNEWGGWNWSMGSEGGGRFDVVVSPNKRHAFISNFGDGSIYKIDVSNPLNPVVVGSQTNVGFFAEDMTISPDGKLLLVTDGGFTPRIGVIDAGNMNRIGIISNTNGNYFNAIEFTGDNRCIAMADYFGAKFFTAMLDETLTNFSRFLAFSFTNALGTDALRPVNLAVSPDGRTAIVADPASNRVAVFEILGSGMSRWGTTPYVTGLGWTNAGSRGSQSIAFSRDGKRAYVENVGDVTDTNTTCNWLSWMKVNGPGNVTLGGAAVARLNQIGSSQLFGVDTLAVTPDGDYVLCSNPTISRGTNVLTLVNTATFATRRIQLGSLKMDMEDPFGCIPVGIAIYNPQVFNDFNNDGASDLTIYDSSSYNWYARQAAAGSTLMGQTWGYEGVTPVTGDYNGDGFADMAVFDGSLGLWHIQSRRNNAGVGFFASWGYAGTIPVPGDYNADGATDMAVYDTSTYKWFIRTLEGRTLLWNDSWGYSGATPVSGDFNGDGRWDQALYYSPLGLWNIKSPDNKLITVQYPWGYAGTVAVSGDYDGDGWYDMAVYDSRNGKWYIRSLKGNVLAWGVPWGIGMTPVPGDFNGDGRSDLAVYNRADGSWYVASLSGGVIANGAKWGGLSTSVVVKP